MSNISSWSTTAASNNSAAPDGFPEGMAPSGVNDAAREVMASVRTFYENIEWRNWGHTPTRTGNTTFTIATDVTAIYVTDRRIQCTDATTLYGEIVSSSYSSPNTTITVSLDSGNLSASLTAVAVGPDVTNDPIHVAGVKDALDKTGDTMTGALTMSGKSIYHANASVAAHATTSDIWVAGNYVTLTGGAVTFTDFADAPVAGVEVELYCNAAHVFTNNANLVIDGAANFTAAAGDRVRVRARSTTVFDLHPIRLSGVLVGSIVTANISDSAVSQAKLKTTTGEITAANGTAANTALPGGEYGFYPQMKTNDSANTRPFGSILNEAGGIPTSYTTWMYIGNTNGTAATIAYAQQRYVQSSPPYEPYRAGDMVPLFVFVLMEKASGRVLSTYTAPDPPWANNGPTLINPLGRIQRLRRQKTGINFNDLKSGRVTRAQFISAIENPSDPTPDEIEEMMKMPISQSEKNADMKLIPHPFLNYDPTSQIVVVLSATDNKFCNGLARMHDMGDSIGEILHEDYLTIDNTPMTGLVTPFSCVAVNARWKLT